MTAVKSPPSVLYVSLNGGGVHLDGSERLSGAAGW